MVGDQDPEFATNDPMATSVELTMYAMQMAADRVTPPGQDIVTNLVEGQYRGPQALQLQIRVWLLRSFCLRWPVARPPKIPSRRV